MAQATKTPDRTPPKHSFKIPPHTFTTHRNPKGEVMLVEATWTQWPSTPFAAVRGVGKNEANALKHLRAQTVEALRAEAAAYDSEAEARVTFLRQWAASARDAANTITAEIKAAAPKRKPRRTPATEPQAPQNG